MQARCLQCFLRDANKVLWLALTAKNSGTRASVLVGIEDDVAALDFDLACTLRLQIYENERANAKIERSESFLKWRFKRLELAQGADFPDDESEEADAANTLTL